MRKSKRTGLIQLAVSCLLLERPMHGYQIMKELADRSGDVYKPSAGTIYPVLQAMQNNGYVHVIEIDGRNVFELNALGKQQTLERIHGNQDDFWEEWRQLLVWKQSKEARLLKEELVQLKEQIRQAEKFVRNQPEQAQKFAVLLSDVRKQLADFQKIE